MSSYYYSSVLAIILVTVEVSRFPEHFYWLRNPNDSVLLNCTRTCGDCYEDLWNVWLVDTRGRTSSFRALESDSAARTKINYYHSEIDVAFIDSDSVECAGDSRTVLVSSSLRVTLLSDDVQSIAQDLVVSCGIGCRCKHAGGGGSFSLYSSLSVVIHLPLHPEPAPMCPACPVMCPADMDLTLSDDNATCPNTTYEECYCEFVLYLATVTENLRLGICGWDYPTTLCYAVGVGASSEVVITRPSIVIPVVLVLGRLALLG